MIAPSPSPSMDDAVTVLRAHASITNRTIRAFANAISARELEVSALQSRAPH
ncbi:hypothetical protein GCM10009792_12180 [Microcella alkalica]|uniref:Uncharacterized protein n=2 Tax=Microcella alkalica TaxID=355930 RepID=A0A839EDL2_9MICO|nr:hypothetical protein [Microcella alkalica]